MSLPLVLLFAALLAVLSLSDTLRVKQGLSTRNNRELALRADYAARTGLQRAVSQLSQDSTWAPPLFSEPLLHDPRASFEVLVVNNFSSATPTTAPDGSVIPGGRVWLSSTGLIDGKPMAGGLGKATSIPAKPETVFDFVVDERRSLYFGTVPSFTNSLVDSYVGGPPSTYTPYLVPGNPATYRLQAKVHSRNRIGIRQTGFVDAQPYASSKALTSLDPNHISGTLSIDPTWTPDWKFRLPTRLDSMLEVSPPSTGAILPGRYGRLTVPAASNVTLESGQYYFNRITLGAGATLTLSPTVSDSAPCEVYLGERLDAGPTSRINPDHSPRHLQIYTLDELEGYTILRFENDTFICATIGGLGAQVRCVERVEFFGAMHVYDFYEGIDTKIHYDESLAGQVLEGSTEWVLYDLSSN